jgi:hypothetical protein
MKAKFLATLATLAVVGAGGAMMQGAQAQQGPIVIGVSTPKTGPLATA